MSRACHVLVSSCPARGGDERKNRTPSQQNQVQKVMSLGLLCKSLSAQVIVLESLFLDKFIQIASVSNGYCRRTLVELVHQACQVQLHAGTQIHTHSTRARAHTHTHNSRKRAKGQQKDGNKPIHDSPEKKKI